MCYPNKQKNEGGSIMLEAIICLPFLFMLMFMTAQIAHIMFCRQVIQYAAVAAGRAVLSAGDTQENEAAAAAARRICALVSYTNEGGTPLKREWLKLGNRYIDGTGGAAADAEPQKLEDADKIVTRVNAAGEEQPDGLIRRIEVNFRVPMLFPVAGDILAGAIDTIVPPFKSDFERKVDTAHYSKWNYFRHILLTGRTLVYKTTAMSDSGINYKEWN